MASRLGAGSVGVITVLALSLGPATAAASITDAQCSVAPDAEVQVDSGERQAQSFTISHSGGIVQAQMAVDNTAAGGDFLLQIVPMSNGIGGIPLNTVLGSVAVPDASVPGGPTTIIGTFSPPVNVSVHGQYALVVTRPGGTFNGLDRSGNPCPGQEFFSLSQTDPWFPDDPNFDLIYKIVVNPTSDFTVGRQTGRLLHLTLPSHGSLQFREARGPGKSAVPARKRARVLKRVVVQAGPGGTTIRLALTKAGKRLLRERGKLGTVGAVTFTPNGGDPRTKLVLLRFTQH